MCLTWHLRTLILHAALQMDCVTLIFRVHNIVTQKLPQLVLTSHMLCYLRQLCLHLLHVFFNHDPSSLECTDIIINGGYLCNVCFNVLHSHLFGNQLPWFINHSICDRKFRRRHKYIVWISVWEVQMILIIRMICRISRWLTLIPPIVVVVPLIDIVVVLHI